MVTNGVHSWLWQRITALVIASYVIWMLGYFAVLQAHLDFVTWLNLQQMFVVRIANSLVLVSMVYHAWLGMWIICTDYLHYFPLRIIVQLGVIAMLLLALLVGFFTFWSI